MRHLIAACGIAVAAAWSGPAADGQDRTVRLRVDRPADHDLIRLDNYRVQLTIDPRRGGAVTAFSDKLAPAELVLPKPFHGLCMDHFQEQSWPGEFLEQPYEYQVLRPGPDVAQVRVWRTSTGLWRDKLANPKLSGILLEKTYTLRADSPALACSIKLTAPADQPKVFSYWLQNVMFAGGDYDPATDRTFRPSARGVRNTGREQNGPYGREEWLRDFTAAWMALIDTRKKTGLALWTDYHDLRINYANVGNQTNELMFNTTYLPKGASVTYEVYLLPIVGLDRIIHVGPEMIVGYRLQPGPARAGVLEFAAVRAVEAVQDVRLTVRLASALDPGRETPVGELRLGPLTDTPTPQTLAYPQAPADPLLIRVAATVLTAAGKSLAASFEDFFPGTYQWADNIQTDMRTPVYAATRPTQRLRLARPDKLAIREPWLHRYLYFQGLHDDAYQVAQAVHCTAWEQKSDIIHYRYSGSWYGELTDFPYDYDRLLSYHAIILGGVSRSGLKPIGLEMLHDYLLAGGGLVVLGSHGAYGRSQLKGTQLGDAFPVEMADTVFDLRPVGGKPVTAGPAAAAFLKYTPLAPEACCYWLHDAKAKPGAQVLLQVDGKPFLVAGEYGPRQARVVCLLGAPLGDPAPGQIPFWRDKNWYLLLRNAIWWAAKKDDHFKE